MDLTGSRTVTVLDQKYFTTCLCLIVGGSEEEEGSNYKFWEINLKFIYLL